MTPEEAQEVIQDEDNLMLVEADLDPDNPEQQGKAQFLVQPLTEEEIDLPDELDLINVENAPPQFRHVALPPEE